MEVFFIFESPYAEMSFEVPNKVGKSLNWVLNTVFVSIRKDWYGYQKVRNFTLISKNETYLSFVTKFTQQRF
jgi:prophage antirepressor-like protein